MPVGQGVNTSVAQEALDAQKTALARRMHASGEPVKAIAEALGASAATVYRGGGPGLIGRPAL